MVKKARGFTKIESFSCNRCNAKYSNSDGARACFDVGLPKILEVGTIYRRQSTLSEDEYFLIEFLTGRPNPKTHERHYVVGAFPESSMGATGYEFVEATASFDGEFLHSIRGEHPRGGSTILGLGKATRLSGSQWGKLLMNGDFRPFYEDICNRFSK
jgi:hypothetical protein